VKINFQIIKKISNFTDPHLYNLLKDSASAPSYPILPVSVGVGAIFTSDFITEILRLNGKLRKVVTSCDIFKKLPIPNIKFGDEARYTCDNIQYKLTYFTLIS
jgi:hypothetical protein